MKYADDLIMCGIVLLLFLWAVMDGEKTKQFRYTVEINKTDTVCIYSWRPLKIVDHKIEYLHSYYTDESGCQEIIKEFPILTDSFRILDSTQVK
jgi:hypothetical protein